MEESFSDVFHLFDTDGSGTIDREEYEHIMALLKDVSQRRAFLFHRIDTDRSESIDKHEFLEGMKAVASLLSSKETETVLHMLEKGPMHKKRRRKKRVSMVEPARSLQEGTQEKPQEMTQGEQPKPGSDGAEPEAQDQHHEGV